MLTFKKFIFICVLLSLFITQLAVAKTEQVVVSGVGVSEEAAAKNAAKTAVMQVVGMYVVSDTAIENLKLIKDEVLSYSNGYIKSLKILDKSLDSDGLIAIEAEVLVEVGKLTEKLNGLNIATKKVEIDKSEFVAKVETQKNIVRDFSSMAEKVIFEQLKESPYEIKVLKFEQLPLENVTKKSASCFLQLFDDKEMRCGNAFNFLDTVNREQKNMIRKGNYLESGYFPFILEFSLKLSNEYLNSVKSFLGKASKQLRFKKKSSNCLYFLEASDEFPGTRISLKKQKFITGFELEPKQLEILTKLFDKHYSDKGLLRDQLFHVFFKNNNDTSFGNIFYSQTNTRNLHFSGNNDIYQSDIPASNVYLKSGNLQKNILRQKSFFPISGIHIRRKEPYVVQNKQTFFILLLLKEQQVKEIKSVNIEILTGN
jgi:hypothetical protein